MTPDPGEESETPVVDFQSRKGASDEEPRGDAVDAILGRLAEIAMSLQRLIDVQFSRARVEMRERILAGIRWAIVGVLLAALTVIASIHLLRGVAGLAQAILSELPWAGDLVAGTVGLLIVMTVGLLVRASIRKAGLRRLRDKFGEGAE